MNITAQPLDGIRRAGGTCRTIVVTVTEDGGRTYSRRYFDGQPSEDFFNAKPVQQIPVAFAERLLADAWGWIEEQAQKFLRTGTDAARRELVGVAQSL